MQQSNVIFGALLICYILFITNKGELGTYIQILRGGGTTATASNLTSNSNSSDFSSGVQAATQAAQIASFLAG